MSNLATLADACEINPRMNGVARPKDEQLVAFIPMAAVDEDDGEISEVAARPFGEVSRGYTVFRSGDVLFAKITPCMQNGKAALVPSWDYPLGCGSTEFHVLRARDGIADAAYIYHFVRWEVFRQRARSAFTGTAGQQRVPQSFLEHVRFPLPPIEEQRRFAAALGRSARLVKLHTQAIAKTRDLIPSLFIDMFGDPASNPKGWPLRRLGDYVSSSRYGPRFPDRAYEADGVPILRTTDIGHDGSTSWENAPRLNLSGDEIKKYAVAPRTLLVTRTGATIGKVALFEAYDEPCVAGAYLIELVLSDEINARFALEFLRSSYGQSRLVDGGRAVAQPNINAPTIKAIDLPVPPFDAQNAFAAKASQTDKILARLFHSKRKAAELQRSLLGEIFGEIQ